MDKESPMPRNSRDVNHKWEGEERFCGLYRPFRPDGTFMLHSECPMAQVVTGAVSEVGDAEVIIERSDGSRITARGLNV
jgi:hypothetical protein